MLTIFFFFVFFFVFVKRVEKISTRMGTGGGWIQSLLVFLYITAPCHALVYEEKMPHLLRNCLERTSHKKGNVTRDTAESIDYMCTKEYLFKTPEERWHPDLDKVINTKTLKKFASLFKELDIGETRSHKIRYRYSSIKRHFVRVRRATPIIRKEIRMLSEEERQKFLKALVAMKADTSDPV